MKPLLSIVVPTKDRYKYLKCLIALIDSFNSKEIELVLQDNTSENEEIVDFLKQKKYSFIKYAHRSEQVPVSYNSDLAILNSTGEYVCFIGDDDGVTPHIIDCINWMKKNDIDALVPDVVSYRWPDYINSITGNISATLQFSSFTKTCEYVDPKLALKELMNKGFINRGNLPLVYHGIVKRETLDEIYEICNSYFPGPSPDIANGVALCFVTKKYARISFPVIVSGASKTHGGGIRKLKSKVSKIEDIPFLPKNAKDDWETNIPKVWTGETVWPESAIKALRRMGHEDLIESVNFEYMFAKFITFHFQLRNLAFQLSDNKLSLWFVVIGMVCMRYYRGLKRIIMRKMFLKTEGQNIVRNLNDIEQAITFLTSGNPVFEITKD